MVCLKTFEELKYTPVYMKCLYVCGLIKSIIKIYKFIKMHCK